MPVRDLIRRALAPWRNATSLHRRLDDLMMLCALEQVHRVRRLPPQAHLQDAEFRVFSQWGEDGIIQFLISHLPQISRVFVEFGVEDYTEANTRFLLLNNNWSGLVLDGSTRNIHAIRNSPIYWQHQIEAQCAFVTPSNINSLISSAGVNGQIGLLSIDIDGNDYWVWRAIETVNPAIVVCEYNALFGVERAITIPLRDDFRRSKAHYSGLYFGASLPALRRLGREKGYAFVGSNAAGNNAFFVRRDICPFPDRSVIEGSVERQFREARGIDGRLSFISEHEQLRLIANLPVVDIETGKTIVLRELL